MNITAASGVTARPSTDIAVSSLALRILSAAVLAPLAIALIWVDEGTFAVLLILASPLMLYEWAELTGIRQTASTAVWLAVAAAPLALGLALVAGMVWGLAALAAGICVAAALLRRQGGEMRWTVLGLLWLGLPCLALLWLRKNEVIGAWGIIWLFVIVWASDTGAYIAGKGIGGPKLAPVVSPNKTWAGLFGGMLAAAAAGAALGFAAGYRELAVLALSAALLAALSQVGDLAESAVKRRFDRKDSGALIPGHGGILDRVDALIFAALGLAVFLLLYPDGAMLWR